MKFFRFLFWLFIIVILVLIWVNRNALVKFLEQFTHGDGARVERELETRKDVIVENKSVDRSKQAVKSDPDVAETEPEAVEKMPQTSGEEASAKNETGTENRQDVNAQVSTEQPVVPSQEPEQTKAAGVNQERGDKPALAEAKETTQQQSQNSENKATQSPQNQPTDNKRNPAKVDRDTKWLMDRALQAAADKEYDTALSAFRELLDKNPQQVEAWHYLADMLHDMGEHERAAKAYANAAILYNKQCRSDLVQSIIPYVRYYAPDLIPRMGIY